MKLSNYIMEQEINTTSIDDIYVEQAVAELEVVSAVTEAYLKATTMMEYASYDTVCECFSFIQEADAAAAKKESSNKVAKFFKAIWEAITRAFKAFVNFFRKTNYKKLIENIRLNAEAIDLVGGIELNEYILNPSNDMSKIRKASEEFVSVLKTKTKDVKDYENVEKILRSIGMTKSGDVKTYKGKKYSSDKAIELLTAVWEESKKTAESCNKLLKKGEFKYSDYDDLQDGNGGQANFIKTIKSIANMIVDVYSKYNKFVIDNINNCWKQISYAVKGVKHPGALKNAVDKNNKSMNRANNVLNNAVKQGIEDTGLPSDEAIENAMSQFDEE